MKLTADELATLRAAEHVKLERRARDAYERALRFEVDNALDEALRWMERAHRLAPSDDAVSFSLATLRLRRGDAPGAALLLLPLVRRLDMRQAIVASLNVSTHAGRRTVAGVVDERRGPPAGAASTSGAGCGSAWSTRAWRWRSASRVPPPRRSPR